jgi:hypothetical protein
VNQLTRKAYARWDLALSCLHRAATPFVKRRAIGSSRRPCENEGEERGKNFFNVAECKNHISNRNTRDARIANNGPLTALLQMLIRHLAKVNGRRSYRTLCPRTSI